MCISRLSNKILTSSIQAVTLQSSLLFHPCWCHALKSCSAYSVNVFIQLMTVRKTSKQESFGFGLSDGVCQMLFFLSPPPPARCCFFFSPPLTPLTHHHHTHHHPHHHPHPKLLGWHHIHSGIDYKFILPQEAIKSPIVCLMGMPSFINITDSCSLGNTNGLWHFIIVDNFCIS